MAALKGVFLNMRKWHILWILPNYSYHHCMWIVSYRCSDLCEIIWYGSVNVEQYFTQQIIIHCSFDIILCGLRGLSKVFIHDWRLRITTQSIVCYRMWVFVWVTGFVPKTHAITNDHHIATCHRILYEYKSTWGWCSTLQRIIELWRKIKKKNLAKIRYLLLHSH